MRRRQAQEREGHTLSTKTFRSHLLGNYTILTHSDKANNGRSQIIHSLLASALSRNLNPTILLTLKGDEPPPTHIFGHGC